jgi:hypothetical protein
MRRYHLEQNVIESQWKLHWDGHVLMGVFDCPCDQERGRFRKRRAFGHRHKCFICHSAKYYKHPRRRQIIADYAFHEGVDEMCDGSAWQGGFAIQGPARFIPP